MRMPAAACGLLLAAGLVSSPLGLAHAAGPPAKPSVSLSGEWRLNHSKSEDASALFEAALAERMKGGKRGPNGRPVGPPPVGPLARLNDAQMRAVRDFVDSGLRSAESLTITEAADEVTIVDDEGTPLHLRPDGRMVKADSPLGSIERHAKRDKAQIVVETRMGPIKITQTFAPAESGELVVTLRLEDPRLAKPLVAKRFYEPPS
jgi:hypothetical protein